RSSRWTLLWAAAQLHRQDARGSGDMTTNQRVRTIAKGWLALGLVGLGLTAAVAISHYGFSAPIHEGHSDKLASSASIARVLLALAFGSGVFALAGWWLLVRSRRP